MAARTSILKLGQAVKDSKQCWILSICIPFGSYHSVTASILNFCLFFNFPSDGKEVKRSPCLHSNFKDSWKFGHNHGINIGLV